MSELEALMSIDGADRLLKAVGYTGPILSMGILNLSPEKEESEEDTLLGYLFKMRGDPGENNTVVIDMLTGMVSRRGYPGNLRT